uniref:Adenosine deaminase n=1 Tax=Nyssomyia neivai TaxID=330878 RepID=A0A1L8DQF0_9DIPT
MLKYSVIWLLATSVVCLAGNNFWNMDKFDLYKLKRSYYIADEEDRYVGHRIELTAGEIVVNDRLMKLKGDEIRAGIANSSTFIPSDHIFNELKRINSSEIFDILKRMPKGGILHAHDTAVCSADFVIKVTYRKNLWQCEDPTTKAWQFIFSRTAPPDTPTCQWKLTANERTRLGEKKYNSILRSQLSLYNTNAIVEDRDVDTVWRKFSAIFGVNFGILTYAPVWKDCYTQFLREMHDDKVQYLELRSTLPQLYDLDGKTYDELAVMQIYQEATEEFKMQNPTYIDSKIIYAPVRAGLSKTQIQQLLNTAVKLHKAYPDFLAGFDLVGQEDKGLPLIDFAEEILKLPKSLKFFFHAGETKWFGMTDNNLLDAVLLGTKRIGHGYAVLKHKRVLEEIKQHKIAIEICPISNQVLGLVDDYRNHPGSILLAHNEYPIVISSDDPSFWEATPLTHDFFMAFLGLAPASGDLRMLKQLALNSITYSAMSDAEKVTAKRLWNTEWKKFIDSFNA